MSFWMIPRGLIKRTGVVGSSVALSVRGSFVTVQGCQPVASSGMKVKARSV